MEPAWLFKGTTDAGEDIQYYIYARKFANFTATPTIASTGDIISFTDTSEASPVRWHWDFGDGTNSTLQNPTHAYATGGNYTVSLTAWNDLGSDSVSGTEYITIYPDPKPAARLTSNYSYSNVIPPLAVAFNDTSVGSITNRSWEFGDGNVSYDPAPVHTFALLPGTVYRDFTINLTVTDQFGRSASAQESIFIYKGYSPAFTAEPSAGPAPLNVTFADLTEDPDQALGRYWEFGDGQSQSDWQQPFAKSVSHEYPSEGNYSVSLTYYGPLEDAFTITREFYIPVQDPAIVPLANFSANITIGKAPLTVAFMDLSTGSPSGWTWDFGDGATSQEQNPLHTFTAAGNYSISLSVSNPDGSNTTSVPDYITVLPLEPPVAAFTANTTAGKTPLAVAFTDTSTGSPTSWNWTFGDGGTSAEQNPVHVYTTPGNFSVSLQVANPDGTNTTVRNEFIMSTVPVLPVAEFTANRTSGQSPLAVGFTDRSAGSPVSWHWTFGDGSTSADQNPVHVYPAPGTYSVSLTASNADGSNTATKQDYITVSSISPPVANFTGRPTSGKAPLSVTFTDSSAGSPDGWYWEFGDGTNSTVQSPAHSYIAAGKYTVSLTATNAGGSNTSTMREYIAVSGSIKPPVANFNAKPTSGYSPLAVTFTDTSSYTPTSWFWDFGDTTNSTERNPVHVYTTVGKYNVTLTATNAGGSSTKTSTNSITVKAVPPPAANFKGTPTSGYAPLAVTFTDLSTGSPDGWSWVFGDGESSVEQNPAHTYISAGKYNVTLTVSGPGGNSTKTRARYITVKTPTPTPTCTQNPCEPHTVPQVIGTRENGKIRLDWDVITNPCLQGYKVVISKNNPAPKYPDDGYMFWITDRYQNSSLISATDHYNGGDFSGYLQPGQAYYFSITAIYSDAKVPGNAVSLTYPSSMTPTPTCTTTPTPTSTQNPCLPYAAPVLNGTTADGKIHLDWDVITNPCLQGYKVVISKNNPNPKYPENGYLFWITDRYQNSSVVSTTDHYNGGDFGGYLQPGEAYYFSITAVYPEAKVPGNVLTLKYPAAGQGMAALPSVSPESALIRESSRGVPVNESGE